MNRRSRAKFAAAAARLQTAYAVRRAAQRVAFEDMRAAGEFLAPEHLAPGLQGLLPLETRLQPDAALAEAA